MKILRKIALILIIVGAVLLGFGILLSAMNVYTALFGPNSVGIIGGADWPTAWLIFRTRALDRYGAMMLTGLVMIAAAIIVRIVIRKKK